MGLLSDVLGGGGSSGKSNTSTTAPWKPAQANLKQVLTDSMKAYQSGIGSQVYTGSTVIPMAKQTTTGLANQMSAAAGAQPLMNKAFNVVAAQAADANGLTPAQEAAMKQQQATAGGAFLNSNKYLDAEIAQNAQDIQRAQQMASSGAGRYGSGGFQAVTQNQIGRMANTARMDNYARERGLMETAQGNVFGMGQAGQNNVIANNQALTGAYGNMMAPGQTMRDVGAQYEDLAMRQKNDELRIFNEKQQQPWKQIGLLGQASQGIGSTGSTTTAAKPSSLQSALGGAIGGYQISGGNPLGTAIGGIAGYYS